MRSIFRRLSWLLVCTASSVPPAPARAQIEGPEGRSSLASSALVPGVASTPGAFGTRWTTTLSLANPQAVPITVRLYVLPSGTDNRNFRLSERSVTLAAGGGTRIADPLAALWGLTGVAALWLESTPSPGNPGAFAVESRVLNIANPAATYGLALAGTLSGITSADQGLAADTESNARYRTNLGLVNDSAESTTALVELLGDDGRLIGSRTYGMPPYSPIQIPITDVTAVPFARATVRVTPSPALTGQLVGYVAIADNVTGDAAAFPIRPFRRASVMPTALTVDLSRYRFSPGGPDGGAIRLRAGETYRITFRALEGTHGLSGVPQLGISGSARIDPDHEYVVEVRPGEELRGARFQIACTEFCGIGHGGMYGAIDIE